MPEANMLAMREAVILWIRAGLLLGLSVFAAALIYVSLALTGALITHRHD